MCAVILCQTLINLTALYSYINLQHLRINSYSLLQMLLCTKYGNSVRSSAVWEEGYTTLYSSSTGMVMLSYMRENQLHTPVWKVFNTSRIL
jgi:hypothetical protein